MRKTTKICECGSTYLVGLTSIDKKLCDDCKRYIDWYLDPGQQPLFEGTKKERDDVYEQSKK